MSHFNLVQENLKVFNDDLIKKSTFSNIVDFVRYELVMVQGSIRNPLKNDFKNIKLRYLFKRKRLKIKVFLKLTLPYIDQIEVPQDCSQFTFMIVVCLLVKKILKMYP